jgi:hypothetical protein
MSILSILNKGSMEESIAKLVYKAIENVNQYDDNSDVYIELKTQLGAIILPYLPQFIEKNKDKIIWKLIEENK